MIAGRRVIVSNRILVLPTVQDRRTGTSIVEEKRVREKSKVVITSNSNNEPPAAKQQASASPPVTRDKGKHCWMEQIVESPSSIATLTAELEYLAVAIALSLGGKVEIPVAGLSSIQ